MRRSRRENKRTRDAIASSLNDSLRFALNRLLPLQTKVAPLSALRSYEDRRAWHPERQFRPAISFNRYRHRLTIGDSPRARPTPLNRSRFSFRPSAPSLAPARIGFEKPDKVLICVRRQIRKQVMNALFKSGRGRGPQRPPRYTWYSKVSCRR